MAERGSKLMAIDTQKLLALLPTIAPWKEAALLLMLQTGCITTELQRLASGNLDLDATVPCLRVTGDLKTASRERTVPLVLGLDRLQELKELLDDGSGFALGSEFSGKDDSNVSHQLNSVVRKIAPDATCYSCRHTVKANGLSRGVDSHLIALIGGWRDSLGINTVQLAYGAAAYTSPETLAQLQSAMKVINRHL